jgi:hypothetical protein
MTTDSQLPPISPVKENEVSEIAKRLTNWSKQMMNFWL